MAVSLRNPHSILATFYARPQAVVDIRLPAGRPTDAWREIEDLARQHRVPVLQAATRDERRCSRSHRESAGGRGGEAEATVKECPEVPLETLFANLPNDGAEPADSEGAMRKSHRLWLALDQIQDPHNVGAIFRTAAFFGIAGIIVTRDRSAPMNGTVYDVASGGIESVPFANPANLARSRSRKAGRSLGPGSLRACQQGSSRSRSRTIVGPRPWK